MKKDLRDKIRAFIASEEGRVSVKAPLALGVTSGSLLLANVIVGIKPADAWQECFGDHECGDGRVCDHHTCRPDDG